MNPFAVFSLVILLGGCATVRSVAPHTANGFEANGLLGAIDGAAGAVQARCRTLDGTRVRLAIDGLSDLSGTAGLLEDTRESRRRICALASLISDGEPG